MGLTIVPDQAPEQGSYYRSDHFSLAKAGIPAFSIKQSQEETPKVKEYREKRYHQPSDEFDESWDFASAVQVAQLAFWFGYEAANAPALVNWNAGEEFAAVRAASEK
jgi:Zn-dependent M28 family amino/carboxypeptidase